MHRHRVDLACKIHEEAVPGRRVGWREVERLAIRVFIRQRGHHRCHDIIDEHEIAESVARSAHIAKPRPPEEPTDPARPLLRSRPVNKPRPEDNGLEAAGMCCGDDALALDFRLAVGIDMRTKGSGLGDKTGCIAKHGDRREMNETHHAGFHRTLRESACGSNHGLRAAHHAVDDMRDAVERTRHRVGVRRIEKALFDPLSREVGP